MDKKVEALENFIKPFISWQEEHSEITSGFEITLDCDKFNSRPAKLIEFMKNEKLRIFVIGSTSSGKSLYINTLFHKSILKSARGHTTPCFVEVSSTDESQSYYEFEDGTKCTVDFSKDDERRAFHKKIDNVRSEAVYSTVRLYISSRASDCTKHVTIVDCPGMERSEFKDNAAKQVESADALVLIVNVESGQNEGANNKILYKCDFFVKPNLIVLFNKSDVLIHDSENKLDNEDYDPDRTHELIENSIKEMLEFLTRPGGPYNNEEEARNAIFFISAKEQREHQMESKDPENVSLILTEDPTAETSRRNRDQKSFGHRKTEARFVIDSESLSMAYADSLRSLLAIAQDQKNEKKMTRLEREIKDCKQQMISAASSVESQLLDLQEKIRKCIGMLPKGGGQNVNNDIFCILPDHAYSELISDEKTKLPGEEKLRIFVEAFHSQKGQIKSSILPSSKTEAVEQRSTHFLDRIFDEAYTEVVQEENMRSREELSKLLDPPNEAFQQLNAEVQKIEQDCSDEFKRRIERAVADLERQKDICEEEERSERKKYAENLEAKRKSMEENVEALRQKATYYERELEGKSCNLKEKKSEENELTATIRSLKSEISALDDSIQTCKNVAWGSVVPILGAFFAVGTAIPRAVYENQRAEKQRELDKANKSLTNCINESAELDSQVQSLRNQKADSDHALKYAEKEKDKEDPPFTSSHGVRIENLGRRIQDEQRRSVHDDLVRERDQRKLEARARCDQRVLEKKEGYRTALREYMCQLMEQLSGHFDSHLNNKIQELIHAREALTAIRQKE